MELTMKTIVQDRHARMSFYRNGNIFYNVDIDGTNYQFPVSLDDIGGLLYFHQRKL